jgi:hypothetical protein
MAFGYSVIELERNLILCFDIRAPTICAVEPTSGSIKLQHTTAVITLGEFNGVPIDLAPTVATI